ncbi:dual specificity protein kinase CLK2-like isoform X2 [Bolinopsis microptera]|uniref:dual specificity protein kinase CLK2-like isoform X2 n=1 Tax=Bolinopsis microptera TaxID=2820187 RepID=UPI003079218D
MSLDYPPDDRYHSRRHRRRKRTSSSRRDRSRSRVSSSRRDASRKRQHSSERRNESRRRPRSSSRKRRESSSGKRREHSHEGRKRRRHSSRRRSRDRSGSDKRRDKRRYRDKDRSDESGKPVKNTEEGHLIFKKCDMLHERYQIKRELGEGTFGKVVLCKDKDKSDSRVAVKVIRNVEKYRDAAQIEIDILEKIRKAGGCEGSVEMFASFNHHGHVCIVFEVLGVSIFDFLKDNGFTPFPLGHIQRMADDVLTALSFLHGMKYTHTDLKPENILFVESEYESVYDKHAGLTVRRVINPRVKLIDFGSATHEGEHHSRIVSTRHYRAPEVIAEIGWSYPCDLWSVGCILFELYTGHTMFQTHDNAEHLGMMEHILGTIPASICQKSKKRYFKDDRLDFDKSGSSGRYIKKYCKKFDKYQREESTAHDAFFDLLRGMLKYTAADRLSASDSLEHRFFDRRLSRDRCSRSYKSR